MSRVRHILNRDFSDTPRRMVYAKVVSVLYVFSAGCILYAVATLNARESRQSDFNWDLGLLTMMLVTSLTLTALHKDMYWFRLWDRKDSADERQQAVRRRVFALSYRILGIVLLLGLTFLKGVVEFNLGALSVSQSLYLPILPLVLFVYALPSAIAAWQKDA